MEEKEVGKVTGFFARIFHLLSLMMVVVLVLVPVIKRVKDSATVSGLH